MVDMDTTSRSTRPISTVAIQPRTMKLTKFLTRSMLMGTPSGLMMVPTTGMMDLRLIILIGTKFQPSMPMPPTTSTSMGRML